MRLLFSWDTKSFELIFPKGPSDCQVTPEGCIIEKPGIYRDQQICTFVVRGGPGVLRVHHFDVRDGDKLTVGKIDYKGYDGPHNVALTEGTRLVWRSDGGLTSNSLGEGFKICMGGTTGPTIDPFIGAENPGVRKISSPSNVMTLWSLCSHVLCMQSEIPFAFQQCRLHCQRQQLHC